MKNAESHFQDVTHNFSLNTFNEDFRQLDVRKGIDENLKDRGVKRQKIMESKSFACDHALYTDGKVVDGHMEGLGSDSQGKRSKKGWSKFYITVEPITFLISLSSALGRGVTIDYLQLYKCHTDDGLSQSECLNEISRDKVSESELDEVTSNILMWKNIVEFLFPLLICTFIGPWSDVNGRKPFIVLPTLSFTLYYLLWGMMSLTDQIPVYFYILPSLMVSLSGGIVALNTSCANYVCDNSKHDNRALNFSILTAVSLVGQVVGVSVSATLINNLGRFNYQIMFFICSILCLCASFYSIFILQETISAKNVSARLFDLELLRSVVSVFRSTKGFDIVFLLILLTGEIMSSGGDTYIVYLVGKSQFYWSLVEYNLFIGVTTVIGAVCHVGGIWLIKEKLKLPNRPVIVVLVFLMMSLQIVKAFSVSNTMFFISASAYTFIAIVGSLTDDELFKLVDERDVGKASIIFVVLDCLCPILIGPMYSQLYNSLLPNKTTYVYFLSAAILFPALITSVGVFLSNKISVWNSIARLS